MSGSGAEVVPNLPKSGSGIEVAPNLPKCRVAAAPFPSVIGYLRAIAPLTLLLSFFQLDGDIVLVFWYWDAACLFVIEQQSSSFVAPLSPSVGYLSLVRGESGWDVVLFVFGIFCSLC